MSNLLLFQNRVHTSIDTAMSRYTNRTAGSCSPSAGSTHSTDRLKNISEARYRAREPSFRIANTSGRGSGKEKGARHTKYALRP